MKIKTPQYKAFPWKSMGAVRKTKNDSEEEGKTISHMHSLQSQKRRREEFPFANTKAWGSSIGGFLEKKKWEENEGFSFFWMKFQKCECKEVYDSTNPLFLHLGSRHGNGARTREAHPGPAPDFEGENLSWLRSGSGSSVPRQPKLGSGSGMRLLIPVPNPPRQ